MKKVLLYRPRHQTAQQFAVEVRRRVQEFDGTPVDRQALVVYVMRRCEEPRFASNEHLIAELDSILYGFLDPCPDERERERPAEAPSHPGLS